MENNQSNSRFHYVPSEHQLGFYVVVSDKDLLCKMQDLMKRQGYLGFMDTAGKLNYFVDGRQNMYKASHTIKSLTPQFVDAQQAELMTAGKLNKRTLKKMAIKLLEQRGFNKQHKGAAVLVYLLPIAFEHEEQITPLNKYLYPLASQKFGISIHQVDRVIRYAARASDMNIGNASLIHYFVDEMTKRLHIYQ